MRVVEVRGVSKVFTRHPGRKFLRDHLRDRFGLRSARVFHALQDVSFDVRRAEGIQIIGSNGAGKSTLLSLIAGLVQPDAGYIRVNGQIRALLELGSGFHPDLTGLENLSLNAAVIGIAEAQIRHLTSKIIEFAELEDCIHEPLRTYSAGMIVRLAFSVAISIRPDVLIVDEVLAAGDTSFRRKCVEAVRALREQGTALLCVSQVAGLEEEVCARAIWLHEGKIVADGEYRSILNQYQEFAISRPSEEIGNAVTRPAS